MRFLRSGIALVIAAMLVTACGSSHKTMKHPTARPTGASSASPSPTDTAFYANVGVILSCKNGQPKVTIMSLASGITDAKAATQQTLKLDKAPSAFGGTCALLYSPNGPKASYHFLIGGVQRGTPEGDVSASNENPVTATDKMAAIIVLEDKRLGHSIPLKRDPKIQSDYRTYLLPGPSSSRRPTPPDVRRWAFAN